MADSDFVQAVDLGKAVHIINTRQIVRVSKTTPGWHVILTTGITLQFDESEADKLINRLPGARPV